MARNNKEVKMTYLYLALEFDKARQLVEQTTEKLKNKSELTEGDLSFELNEILRKTKESCYDQDSLSTYGLTDQSLTSPLVNREELFSILLTKVSQDTVWKEGNEFVNLYTHLVLINYFSTFNFNYTSAEQAVAYLNHWMICHCIEADSFVKHLQTNSSENAEIMDILIYHNELNQSSDDLKTCMYATFDAHSTTEDMARVINDKNAKVMEPIYDAAVKVFGTKSVKLVEDYIEGRL